MPEACLILQFGFKAKSSCRRRQTKSAFVVRNKRRYLRHSMPVLVSCLKIAAIIQVRSKMGMEGLYKCKYNYRNPGLLY